MSAGMLGADPRALRDMARQFDDAAHRLMGVRSSVQGWVDRAGIWSGPDHRRFTDAWETTGAAAIVDAASVLHRCAGVLRANADAQEGASAADGGGTGGGGSGSRSGLFGAHAKLEPTDVWGIVAGAASDVVGYELAPGMSVGDVTGLLASLGIPAPAGLALDIGLAVPELIEDYRDPTLPLEQKLAATGRVGIDMVSGGLMAAGVHTRNPAAFLAGVGTMTWGTVATEATKVDYSAEGFRGAIDYVVRNPKAVGEELGKATQTVFTDWGKTTLTSIVSGVRG